MFPQQLSDLSIRSFQIKEFVEASAISIDSTLQECIVVEGAFPGGSVLSTPGRVDAFMVGVCTGGEADVLLNLQRVTIKKNDFFSLAPMHLSQIFEQRDFQATMLLISSEWFNSINIDTKQLMPLSIELGHAQIAFDDDEVAAIAQYIRRIAYELSKSVSPFTKDLIGSLVAATMYKVGDLLSRHIERHSELNDVKNRAEDYFKQFVYLLGKNYLTERGVGFYADSLNITPKYLTTLIKRVSGRSVSQWIDYYVTIEAKTMLKFTDKSILEISNALNFANQSFFGSYFRRNTGMSPSQYRALK